MSGQATQLGLSWSDSSGRWRPNDCRLILGEYPSLSEVPNLHKTYEPEPNWEVPDSHSLLRLHPPRVPKANLACELAPDMSPAVMPVYAVADRPDPLLHPVVLKHDL